jgi:hypothetical protein
MAALLMCVAAPCLRAQPLPIVPPEQRGSSAMERMGHHDQGSIRTLFWNFGMVGDFPNDPLHVDLSTFHSVEAPKGSGMNYSDGITPFVLARILTTGGQTAYLMETGYRERQAIDPNTGQMMRLEPRPGYFQESPEINLSHSPAVSTDPTTWPPLWFDKLGDPADPGWAGEWNGYFGKGAVADQESYSVMDDQAYATWDFQPDARDATRRGLALRIAARGLQWTNSQARNVIFWHYDVTNEGTTPYNDALIFGMYVDPSIGGSRLSCDGIFESDDDNAYWDRSGSRNLAYAWDRFGHGVDLSGVCSPAGYFGYTFLETPGNAADGVDNDRDGITDESPNGGPGTQIVGHDAIVSYVAAHDDLARFSAYYGSLENRPAVLAGSWWTGDEDLDWVAALDDLGADGLPGTNDLGEGDGVPTAGEPNFDRTDADEVDQLGLTGFKQNRIRAGAGNPDPRVDNILFYTDANQWPQRLWEQFTAPNPADRFDGPLVSFYNFAYLTASGPFTLDVGQTRRFSVALGWAPTLDSLDRVMDAAVQIHRGDYQLLTTDVPGTAVRAVERARLMGNSPNPFRGRTRIALRLAGTQPARLEIFDLHGRQVAIRDLGSLAAGEAHVTFDAGGLATGLYLYRIRLGAGPEGGRAATLTGRMVVMR